MAAGFIPPFAAWSRSCGAVGSKLVICTGSEHAQFIIVVGNIRTTASDGAVRQSQPSHDAGAEVIEQVFAAHGPKSPYWDSSSISSTCAHRGLAALYPNNRTCL